MLLCSLCAPPAEQDDAWGHSGKPGLVALHCHEDVPPGFVPPPFATYAARAGATRRAVSRHGTPQAPYPRQLAFVHWLCLYLCELSLRDFGAPNAARLQPRHQQTG